MIDIPPHLLKESHGNYEIEHDELCQLSTLPSLPIKTINSKTSRMESWLYFHYSCITILINYNHKMQEYEGSLICYVMRLWSHPDWEFWELHSQHIWELSECRENYTNTVFHFGTGTHRANHTENQLYSNESSICRTDNVFLSTDMEKITIFSSFHGGLSALVHDKCTAVAILEI